MGDQYKTFLGMKITAALKKHVENEYKFLFFPINSNRNRSLRFNYDHWTLLMLHTADKKWKYYNSNIPWGSEDRKDDYLDDAKLVMNIVTEKLKLLNEAPSFTLDSQNGYELEVVKDCSFQGPTSDCALFV